MNRGAIEKIDGACVVLAGAGTGKTFTIVEKVKHLVKNNIYPPEKIVCITFSNEAANSLQARIMKELKTEKMPIVRTFHGFSADLLREYGELININKEFKILDPNEAKVFLHRYLGIKPYYCHKYIESIMRGKDFGISVNIIEDFLMKKIKKFEGIDIEKKLADLQFEFQTFYLNKSNESKKNINDEIEYLEEVVELKRFVNAWKAYEKLKDKKNYLDYSDLNIYALKLLKNNISISEKFSYLIVDEFQDTNKIQLDLIFSLAPRGNLTVVGDMNQSIYGFRGAYKENFVLFKRFYSITEKDYFTLAQSFRSPNNVLRVAHKLIENNYSNKDDCFMVANVHNREGEHIHLYELKNGNEEARKIVEIIDEKIKKGVRPQDICVMFRSHQQGILIRKALEERKISFSSVSKGSLLKQKDIKLIIDYLTILEKMISKKKGGEQAWWDLIYQFGFLEEDLIYLGKFIKDNKNSDNLSETVITSIENLPLSEPGLFLAKMIKERLVSLIPLAIDNVPILIGELYKQLGFYGESFNREEQELLLNLNRFKELAENHSRLYSPDLPSFLHYLSILQSLDISIDSVEVEKEGIRLMTLHATKGLEYDTVIISNLAQKRFPIEKGRKRSLIPSEVMRDFDPLAIKEDGVLMDISDYELSQQLSEERRLFYVALTRTKQNLYMTYAKEYSQKNFARSQFLDEINYSNNKDIIFITDLEEKTVKSAEQRILRPQFSYILSSPQFSELIKSYAKRDNNDVRINLKKNFFSPSALLLFSDCKKRYEYKYVYNMPDSVYVSWEEMRLGSFVHLVLEKGVEEGFTSLDQFVELASELFLEDEWESVSHEEALRLIKVFYERNKRKYDSKSKTEYKLWLEIEGLRFMGVADRIDFRPEGIEIVDYKTGNAMISPKHRNWQLGYYALAAKSLGKVKKVTLDMLKHEKPLEFEIDENGNASSIYSIRTNFNIYEVEKELIAQAKELTRCYEHGFSPCAPEKNCEFCNEYIYNR